MTISDKENTNFIRTIAILCLVFGFLCGMLVGYFTLNLENEKVEEPSVNYTVIYTDEE